MNEFESKTDSLKNTMVEIQKSINTIAHAIEEGAKGVSNAADSTAGTGYGYGKYLEPYG